MNEGFRYLIAGLLILLVLILQRPYLKWLGFEDNTINKENLDKQIQIVKSKLDLHEQIKNLEANVPLIGPECAIPLQTPIDNLKAISETIKKWHLDNPKNFG